MIFEKKYIEREEEKKRKRKKKERVINVWKNELFSWKRIVLFIIN